jgi:hypothetical protein
MQIEETVSGESCASLAFATDPGALPSETVANIKKTLRNWQQNLGTTSGASVDPASSHGPLSFNSIALFRIALVRLHQNLGPYRGFKDTEPGLYCAVLLS